MPSVTDSHTVFTEKIRVEEATISSGGQSFQKQELIREDAVAVLLLNTDTHKIILTRQFRYPIHVKTEATLLEIIAGRIDKIRNTYIQFLLSCFATPGYSSACFYIYYATVTDVNKPVEGGGLSVSSRSLMNSTKSRFYEVRFFSVLRTAFAVKQSQYKEIASPNGVPRATTYSK